MANVTVYNMEGNEVGTMELNDAVFGVEINEHLVHLAVVRQLANKRQVILPAVNFACDMAAIAFVIFAIYLYK